MGSKYHESVWRRGWTDTKRGWKDWRFIVLEVAGSPIYAVMMEDVYATAYFAIGCLLAVWIAMTATAPVKQRNEARESLGNFDHHKSADVSQLQLLEFSIDVGDISILTAHEPDASDEFVVSLYRLVLTVAFLMNKPVQISDIGLLIDSDDVRGRIAPLFGQFTPPHVLDMSGEYKFTFDIPRRYITGTEHQLLLRVVAAGKPYTDEFPMLFKDT